MSEDNLKSSKIRKGNISFSFLHLFPEIVSLFLTISLPREKV